MFSVTDSSAGLDLAVLETAEREKTLLTFSLFEVKVWRNCFCVILSVSLCCMCSEAYSLSSYVGRSRVARRDEFWNGFCLEARISIA